MCNIEPKQSERVYLMLDGKLYVSNLINIFENYDGYDEYVVDTMHVECMDNDELFIKANKFNGLHQVSYFDINRKGMVFNMMACSSNIEDCVKIWNEYIDIQIAGYEEQIEKLQISKWFIESDKR